MEWERILNATGMPTLEQLTDFIETRCRAMDAVLCHGKSTAHKESRSTHIGINQYVSSTSENVSEICEGSHSINRCSQFLEMCYIV